MTPAKLFPAILLAAAALTAPAMARGSFAGADHAASHGFVRSAPAEHAMNEGGCVRAPRVGAFASMPWAVPPCEPNTAF